MLGCPWHSASRVRALFLNSLLNFFLGRHTHVEGDWDGNGERSFSNACNSSDLARLKPDTANQLSSSVWVAGTQSLDPLLLVSRVLLKRNLVLTAKLMCQSRLLQQGMQASKQDLHPCSRCLSLKSLITEPPFNVKSIFTFTGMLENADD